MLTRPAPRLLTVLGTATTLAVVLALPGASFGQRAGSGATLSAGAAPAATSTAGK